MFWIATVIRKKCFKRLHYQLNNPQGKLVRVIHGEIQDVVVDLRRHSETFSKHISVNLSSESLKQLWIPPGFAHGFLVKTKTADVLYKMTNFGIKMMRDVSYGMIKLLIYNGKLIKKNL